MKESKNSLVITIVICFTAVILIAIAGWVYINNKKIAQDDAQFQNSQITSELDRKIKEEQAELDRKLKEEQIEQQKNQNRNDCYAQSNPNNMFEQALCAEM